MSSLTDSILANYPGAYDHLDPADLEQAIIGKYPGAYDHLTEHINNDDQTAQDSSKSFEDITASKEFLAKHPILGNLYSKDPSKEPSLLPDIKQPETFTGGFLKSLYDQYVKPLGTLPGMAESVAGIATGGIQPESMPIRTGNLGDIAARAKSTELSPHDTGLSANLPFQRASMVPVGEEPAITSSPINSEQKLYDLARNRFGMGQDLPSQEKYISPPGSKHAIRVGNSIVEPETGKLLVTDINKIQDLPSDIQLPSMAEARQGLMSETGGLGSGEKPPIDKSTIKTPLKSIYPKRLDDIYPDHTPEERQKVWDSLKNSSLWNDETGGLGSGEKPPLNPGEEAKFTASIISKLNKEAETNPKIAKMLKDEDNTALYQEIERRKQGITTGSEKPPTSNSPVEQVNSSNKTDDYLSAEQFFKSRGKNPLALSPDATDVKYDSNSGTFIPTDSTGKQVGLPINAQGDLPKPGVMAESKYFRVNPKDLPKPQFSSGDNTDFLTKASNKFAQTARSVLGVHIPGTAFSIHGINEVMRHTLFGGYQSMLNMPGRAGEGLFKLINPKSATKVLEQVPMGDLSNAVNKHGLQMDISDVDVPSLFKGNNLITKGINFITDPTPLFRQVIPNLKFKTYQNVMKNLVSKGLSENEAGKTAADYANTTYGGVTPNGMSADPTFRKVSRLFALAPDWMTSNYRLGRGTAQALMNPLDPRGQMYIKGMTNFMGAYAAANVFNKLNTGHYMWQNDPGKELAIAMGKDAKGRVRYANPFGTAMDFARLPMAIAHSALSGDLGESFQLIKDRGSEPLQLLGALGFNKSSSTGQPMFGRDKFGRHKIPVGEQATNIASETASHILPIGADALIDHAQGKISDEEAATKFFQLPMTYKKPSKTNPTWNPMER